MVAGAIATAACESLSCGCKKAHLRKSGELRMLASIDDDHNPLAARRAQDRAATLGPRSGRCEQSQAASRQFSRARRLEIPCRSAGVSRPPTRPAAACADHLSQPRGGARVRGPRLCKISEGVAVRHHLRWPRWLSQMVAIVALAMCSAEVSFSEGAKSSRFATGPEPAV
jgi:hypothetical protein